VEVGRFQQLKERPERRKQEKKISRTGKKERQTLQENIRKISIEIVDDFFPRNEFLEQGMNVGEAEH
jgi:hypothetical protein